MNRTTVAALCAALLLGGWLLLFERGEPDETTEGEPVFGMAAEEVASVSLLRPDEPAVHLERRDDAADEAPEEAFTVREGEGEPEEADATEVDLLLQNIESLRFERRLSEDAPLDLAGFGLAEPALTVRVARRNAGGADETPLEAAFGAETPAPGNRYLRFGDEVLIVSDWSRDNFDRSAWDLTDKRLFRFDTAGVRSVRLTAGDREAAVERAGGDWWIVQPFRFAADPYDASQLASKVREARMIGRVRRDSIAGTDDPFGFAEPRLTARFEVAPEEDADEDAGDADGAPTPFRAALHFGNPSDDPSGVFVRIETDRRPSSDDEDATIFVVAESLFEELEESVRGGLAGVRSVRLFRFSAWQVTELRLAGPEGETVFRRQDEDDGQVWLREPAGGATDGDREAVRVAGDAVDDLLYRLNSTNAAAVTDSETLPEPAAGSPARTITVREEPTALPGGEPPRAPRTETVRFVAAEDGEAQALRLGDERTLRLREADWEGITELLRALEAPPDSEDDPEDESARDPEDNGVSRS